MSTQTALADASDTALDPVYRSSEVIFGLLMAMSFIGSISVATDGKEEVRTLLVAALGCNLAWGLVDAVMPLVAVKTEKRRIRVLLEKLHGSTDHAAARAAAWSVLPCNFSSNTRMRRFSVLTATSGITASTRPQARLQPSAATSSVRTSSLPSVATLMEPMKLMAINSPKITSEERYTGSSAVSDASANAVCVLMGQVTPGMK